MGSSGCGKSTLMSCIVGTSNLDSGSIEVFGEPLDKLDKSRVGFMPQESALIPGFTVREMIWFFGTIFGLSSEKIDERFRFLSSMLELPDRDRLIRDCSGGQQRRISFALTLVHEPDLLILDEPTVGIDPLLRNRIWDYLIELTESNVTILLSTHYIEEARHSTHVGIMRNGVQMVEDTPERILRMCETDSLEEAFLRLSRMQENEMLVKITTKNVLDVEISQRCLKKELKTSKSQKTGMMKALLTKNKIQLKRYPGYAKFSRGKVITYFFLHFSVTFLSLFLPFLTIIFMNFSIGREIVGYSLGIVDDELISQRDCLNSSFGSVTVEGTECVLNKISCRFINLIDKKFATLVTKLNILGLI